MAMTQLAALGSLPEPAVNEVRLEQSLKTTDLRTNLRRCHELFIEPLAEALASESQLLIVPDRDLFALPFAALIDSNDKYLIERHVLRVIPSVGTLIELKERVAARLSNDGDEPTALVVGDPDFHGWANQLPGARAEADEVCKRLREQGRATTYLSRSAATKPAVVEAMRTCEILHLATHGAPSGVYLSGSTDDEGMLTMAEVQALQLPQAKLVVLSECDSFRGELKADGVIGITRAFMAAGSPTLVASLWQVDDHATRVLMMRFYHALLGEAAGDAAVALQKAMVSMLQQGNYSEREWASFVVYGLASAHVTAVEPIGGAGG